MYNDGFRGFALALLMAAAAAAVSAPGAEAKGKGAPSAAPQVIEEKVEAATNFTPVKFLTKMTVKDDPTAVGFLQESFEFEKDRKYELLVSLHGHGADPKGFLYYPVASRRKSLVLIVQGRTPAGDGFAWDDSSKEYVVGLAMHVLSKYPVDPKKVVIAGHSAGGHMALVTYKHAPHLFAGIITTAGASGPDSSHYDARTVVFLGTRDPNYALAPSVRSNFENKKRRAPGSLRIVQDLGHDIADFQYFDQAMEWILNQKARGWEISLPLKPPAGWQEFAHIFMQYSGAEGAPASLKIPKSKVLADMKGLKKMLSAKTADFFMEAAKFSADQATAASGGMISAEGLAAFSEELSKAAAALKPGETSEVLESPRGMHIVARLSKEEEKAEEKSPGDGE